MGGDHGHGHGRPYIIPDWKIYKVENCPEMLAVKNALARKGLKDPWLRNEVWRFDPKQFGTEASRIKLVFFRGFKFGFAAFVATIAIEKVLEKLNPPAHNHGHH